MLRSVSSWLCGFLAVCALVAPVLAVNNCLSNEALSAAIVSAVQSLQFNETFDLLHNSTTHAVNNLDVSVISFDDTNQCPPAFANVLLTRDFPNGRVSSFDPSQGVAGESVITCIEVVLYLRQPFDRDDFAVIQVRLSASTGAGGTMFDGKRLLLTNGMPRRKDSMSLHILNSLTDLPHF